MEFDHGGAGGGGRGGGGGGEGRGSINNADLQPPINNHESRASIIKVPRILRSSRASRKHASIIRVYFFDACMLGLWRISGTGPGSQRFTLRCGVTSALRRNLRRFVPKLPGCSLGNLEPVCNHRFAG